MSEDRLLSQRKTFELLEATVADLQAAVGRGQPITSKATVATPDRAPGPPRSLLTEHHHAYGPGSTFTGWHLDLWYDLERTHAHRHRVFLRTGHTTPDPAHVR
jgi:hypothetical protein